MTWSLSFVPKSLADIWFSLDSSTIDLPGYGPGDWENIDRLYTAGTKAAEHTRRTQADAGRSAICLWFTRFNRNHDNDEEDISRMTDRLEEFVYECELDLVTGMTYTPLHGHLAVLRYVIPATLSDHHGHDVLY